LPKAQLTLRLLGERACRGLNRRFRGLDQATDILSFPARSGRPSRGFDGYLGDLALCLPYAWRKRGRFKPRFEAEAAFLILHGLLHLTGRHHDSPAQERELWRLQNSIAPAAAGSLAALAGLKPIKMRS
jgi:probable rRNA maturation factor